MCGINAANISWEAQDETEITLVSVAQLVGASSHEPKGRQFDSHQDTSLGCRFGSPVWVLDEYETLVGVHMRGNGCFSPSLPPFPTP